MTKYYFSFASSYQGSTWYKVSGAGDRLTELELRREAPDYEREQFKGDSATWERDFAASVGLLRASHNSQHPLPAGMLKQFNAWRQGEHLRHKAMIEADREKYGPVVVPPLVPWLVHSAHYDVRSGWVIDEMGDTEVIPEQPALGDVA